MFCCPWIPILSSAPGKASLTCSRPFISKPLTLFFYLSLSFLSSFAVPIQFPGWLCGQWEGQHTILQSFLWEDSLPRQGMKAESLSLIWVHRNFRARTGLHNWKLLGYWVASRWPDVASTKNTQCVRYMDPPYLHFSLLPFPKFKKPIPHWNPAHFKSVSSGSSTTGLFTICSSELMELPMILTILCLQSLVMFRYLVPWLMNLWGDEWHLIQLHVLPGLCLSCVFEQSTTPTFMWRIWMSLVHCLPSLFYYLFLPLTPSASFLLALLFHTAPFPHFLFFQVEKWAHQREKGSISHPGLRLFPWLSLCQAIWLATAELDEKSWPFPGILQLPLPHMPITTFWINTSLFSQ